MSNITAGNLGTVVLTERADGHSVVPEGTPLTFLNYFDGMLMRAELMNREQAGFTALSKLSNQAGGHGVVWGFDTELKNNTLNLGAGLAIDSGGRVVYSPDTIAVGIADLIAASAQVATPTPRGVIDSQAAFGDCVTDTIADPAVVVEGVRYYVITVGQIDAVCGDEDVYGRLCEEACITASDRPYRVRGVVVRAEPLNAALSLPGSNTVELGAGHLRSRIASGFFEYERRLIASRISGAGLGSDVWCKGSRLPGSIALGVPVGLLARSGSENLFLDRWIVTRERIEAPARRYWAQVMAMRPWNVFLAQVLQFQCQLNNLFQGGGAGEIDPCADVRSTVRRSSERLAALIEHYERTSHGAGDHEDEEESDPVLSGLREIESGLKGEATLTALTPNRLLISGGIVELPSAGYLPVDPGSKLTVNDQVRRMMGEGVDLRFCVVRPDFVPHALEEAQHMERISLLQGLDDPANKPKVDVLVPEGEITSVSTLPSGTGYEMTLDLEPLAIQLLLKLLRPVSAGGDDTFLSGPRAMLDLIRASQQDVKASFRGAARGAELGTGGYGFYFAGAFLPQTPEGPPAFTLIELLQHSAVWIGSELDRDPFEMNRNESTGLLATLSLQLGGRLIQARISGDLQIRQKQGDRGDEAIDALLTGSLAVEMPNPAEGEAVSRVISVSDNMNLKRHGEGPHNPAVEVVVANPSLLSTARNLVLFESGRFWNSAATARVDGGIKIRKPSQPTSPSFTLIELADRLPLYAAAQTVNPNVLKPSNPDHQSALTAIRAIATALGNPGFEDLAARKLFPPPQKAESELKVKAIADWVLFHRRRDKRCEPDAVPAAELSSRRYRVYHIGLKDESQIEDLIDALRNNDSARVTRFEPRPAGVIEFAAGIQTLESSPEVARAEWASRVPESADIVYGAVASVGEALDEGEALARARLGNLTSVLAPVTPASEDVRLQFLQSVPDGGGITAEPYDGVMIAATIPVAGVCQEVYRFKASSHQAVSGLIRTIEGRAASDIHDELIEKEAVRLGQARFRRGAGGTLSESNRLSEAWTEQGGGEVTHIVSISQRPDVRDAPTDAEKERIEGYRKQAAQIVESLGTPIAAQEIQVAHPEDDGILSPCPSFTVVVTQSD